MKNVINLLILKGINNNTAEVEATAVAVVEVIIIEELIIISLIIDLVHIKGENQHLEISVLYVGNMVIGHQNAKKEMAVE